MKIVKKLLKKENKHCRSASTQQKKISIMLDKLEPKHVKPLNQQNVNYGGHMLQS